MKVLLLQDVDRLGLAGDVKTVADGFGRNYLLPQGLAILASPGALKQAATIRKAGEVRRAQDKADAEAIGSIIEGKTLTFERRAGETGKLYGSVTANDIAQKLSDEAGTAIDKRKIGISEPIRMLGEHEVTIRLMVEVAAQIKVVVMPEGGARPEPETAEAPDLAPAEEAPIETETALEDQTLAEEVEQVVAPAIEAEAGGEEETEV